MPTFVVTGKLGGGKTLAMVGRMRDYINAGRPVATNIDLNLGKLVQSRPVAPVWRLPDRPSVDALEALGVVHDTGREELNGALVLDECGAWLNARTWADAGRQKVIDWMLHSRKKGWDVYLIVQNLSLLDKQLRDTLAENVVLCGRMDRVRVPLLGVIGRALTFGLWSGRLPAVHIASVRYGTGPTAVIADRWFYRGRDLYSAYSTTQVIREDSSVGLHALLWPLTPAELEALRRRPKPKLPQVLRAAALGPDAALPLLADHFRRLDRQPSLG